MSVNEVKLRKAEIEFEVRGTGHAGSRTFAIGDEDHTLGNCLRHVLIQNQKIAFAGYSVPHPSEPVVHLRVQTAKGSANAGARRGDSSSSRRRRRAADEDDEIGVDSEGEDRMTAVDALKEACRTLSDQCDFVLGAVEEALPEVKEDRERIEKLALTGAHDDDDEEDEDE
jgi:DNA-directed RNA polymerase I and III subunit RPAC2